MPPPADRLQKKVRDAWSLADRASATGVIPYLEHVVIDSRPDPRPFREVAEPWQWKLAHVFSRPVEHVAGLYKGYPGPYLHMAVLPKGHDKSSLIARLANWALAYTNRHFTGYVYAADKEQAGYLSDAMAVESELNPWLRNRLHFKNWEVSGANRASVTVMAADAAGAQGARGDLIICDELTHWKSRDLWDSLKSGFQKRPGCVVIVITNAGHLGGWQHGEFEAASSSRYWWVYHAPGRLASWMDEGAIADGRRTMPPGLARRLYDNAWVPEGDDDGYLTREEVAGCLSLASDLSLVPREEGDADKTYTASVDYGSVKDRCVLCVGHTRGDAVVLDKMDVWQGSRASPVPVARVEAWLEDTRKKFRLDAVVADTYQLEGTIQRFEGLLPVVRWTGRGGVANHQMAVTFRSLVVNRRLLWPHGLGDLVHKGRTHTFADELTELRVRYYANGSSYRVDHLPNLHDDRFVAAAMLAEQLVTAARKRKLFTEGSLFW